MAKPPEMQGESAVEYERRLHREGWYDRLHGRGRAVHVSPDRLTVDRLERAAKETGRTVGDLATAAVEEAALDWARKNGFPGEGQ